VSSSARSFSDSMGTRAPPQPAKRCRFDQTARSREWPGQTVRVAVEVGPIVEIMRGAGDHLSIGERIAFYRRRRLSALAHALRVSLGDLLGQPVLVEDEHNDDDVPAVRDALMAPHRLSRTLFADQAPGWRADLEQTRRLTESTWDDYQRGRITRVIAILPRLIRSAQALEEHEPSGARWRVSSRIHHLAATTLIKVGEADLAWIAGERAMSAADNADDPLALASAARAATHGLLAVGRYDDAIELGRAAHDWLSSQLHGDDPEALSLIGMLDLRMALAAARRQDRATTRELLARAERAADRLGEDANYWQTAFGPTNVVLHRIAAALDLGDLEPAKTRWNPSSSWRRISDPIALGTRTDSCSIPTTY